MRTKQLRLNDTHQIRSRIREFIGKKISVVLIDNTVMFGELKNVNADGISLMNMRSKTEVHPFDRIAEIYLDTIV